MNEVNVSRPVNVEVVADKSIRSTEQLIRRFLRKCKDEGIILEHLDQFDYETKGQKNRRKRREGKARHRRKNNPRKDARKSVEDNK